MSHNITPLVSIHIITYNQIDFIHETLTSALNQDYENLEVVVADDGSTDGTAEVILEYAEKYPKRLVPLVGGPNLGITGNSNRGLKACKGKYIAFQGGDDVLLPGKITAQVAWMEEDENRVLCGHPVRRVNERGGLLSEECVPSWAFYGQGMKLFLRYGSPFAATAVMVRASDMPSMGFDERLPMVSDWKLWLDYLSLNGSFGSLLTPFALYRDHGKGVTKECAVQCYREAVQTLWFVLKENPLLFLNIFPNLLARIYYLLGAWLKVLCGQVIK